MAPRQDAQQPKVRQLLDCASPLALSLQVPGTEVSFHIETAEKASHAR